MLEQQHSRIRRRTQHQHHSTTLFNSITWYLLLSASCFLWGAYNSLQELSQHQYDNHNHRHDYDYDHAKPLSEFSLAYYQSYGFFDDIPTDEWQQIRSIAKSGGMTSSPRTTFDPRYDGSDDDDTFWNSMPSNLFYGYNYDPNFSCRSEVRIGGQGDGPKFVCDPHRLKHAATLNWRMLEGSNGGNEKGHISVNRHCLVYSVGSGGNFKFEIGLQEFLEENRCDIHVFDGTDYSASIPEDMDIHFHNWGLRRDRGPNTNDDFSPDENMAFPQSQKIITAKHMSLSQIMKMLGHSGEVLDILKIDCEGCEWKTYMDWLGDSSVQSPRQVLIEVHRSPAPFTRTFFNEMKNHGYVTFHKEPNLPGCPRGDCIEYGFLKLHPDFYS